MKMLLRRRARPARTWRLPLRAAIVVEGGNSDQAGDLFAADAAQFGQADDQRQRGAQADALDGYEQVKPARQRGVPGKRGGRQRHVGITAPFETGDIALVQALEPRHPRRLGHRLQHHDLLLELLQVGQFGIEGIEAGVRQRRQLIETGREGGDLCRIEPVVLGVPEPAPGEGAHLRRLQPRRFYRPATQMRKQPPFVAARRLEADAGHALLGHKGIELLQPGRRHKRRSDAPRRDGWRCRAWFSTRRSRRRSCYDGSSSLPLSWIRTETFMQPYGSGEEAGRDPAPHSPKG